MALLCLMASASIFSQALTKEELDAQKQSNFKKNRLAFNIGLTNPTGDFASTNITDVNSGFAQSGLLLSANYTIMTSKSFGFSFDFKNANFDVESSELEAIVIEQFRGLAREINFNVDNYNHSQLTFGFFVQFGEETKFYFNPVFGYSNFSFAETFISGVTIPNNQMVPPDVSFTEVQSGPNDEALFFGINAGLDIPISSEISFNINVQYFSIEYEFDGFLNYSDSQLNSARIPLNYDQQVSAFLLGLGITHYF